MPPSIFRPRTREQATTLWSFVGTVLAAITGWTGAGYAVAGDHAARSPSFHVLKHLVPGQMHTVGAILLLMAAAMAYVVLSPFNRLSVWLLRVFVGVTFMVGLSFAGSWFVTGRVVWGGPILWTGLGALAEGMVLFPPDSLPTKGDSPDAPELDPLSGRRE